MSSLDRVGLHGRRITARWSAVIVVPLLFLACEDRPAPVAPTPPPTPAPAPAPAPTPAGQPFFLSGSVADTAFRSLADARVEVVDGPLAGTTVTTNHYGDFSLPGEFTGTVRLVATKDGYQSQTKTWSRSGPPPPPGAQTYGWVSFNLELPVASANVSGPYSLTVTADSSCTTLPEEARARTYTAQIAPSNTPNGFAVTLSGSRFFTIVPCPWERYSPGTCALNRFGIGTAADYVGGYVAVIEQLSDTTYLIFNAVVEGSATPGGISASLDGSLLYCPGLPVQVDQGEWLCPAASAAASCEAHHHRLELIRR